MKTIIPLLYDVVLPNGPLPNAIMTELGVVNYLHSLHTSHANYNMLEQEYGNNDSTLIGTVFNNNYGQFPNSLSGCHLYQPCYNEVIEVHKASLYNHHTSLNKYIYPVKITPHFEPFVGISQTGSKINGQYFWKFISNIALNDIKSNKGIILLDFAQENFIEKNSYMNLHESLKSSGIPKEQIILGFNSFNAQEVYESWFPEHERMLTVKNWPFVIMATSYHYYENSNARLSLDEFYQLKNTHRKHKFLFKVRRPREHRLALLAQLISDDILQQGDWSCLSILNFTDHEAHNLMREFNINFDIEKVRNITNNLPKSLDSEMGTNYTDVRAWTDTHPNAYRNSYFYICTETFTHEPHKSLTEKVFKPIVNFQPFLFVAYPGALQMLRELGFKTFDGFIDESYDLETDRNKRIVMIYNEIKRLTSMSTQELHDWYYSMEDILVYNNQYFLSFWQNNSRCMEFIKYLTERLQ